MPTGLEVLRSAFSVGTLTTPNRIVMAPMTRQHSPGGTPTAEVANYYAARTRGGVGLIITEGVFVSHASAGFSTKVPHLGDVQAQAGWRTVTDAVHAEGGTIAAQLWHVGVTRPEGSGAVPEAPTLGPSGVGLDGNPSGRAATSADLDAIVAAFAQAAADAVDAGFDAVEVHGAHGYLVDQFLWERTNRRDDAYGTGLRTKLAVEIVQAIRDRVPENFPVLFRFSQWKSGAYDQKIARTPRELESILTPLTEAGVDVFHASTRRYWLPEFDDSPLNLAGWAKKLTGRPAITVGSVGLDTEFTGPTGWSKQATPAGLDNLVARLERDEFDLVAVGRALIADPTWARNALSGKPSAVRYSSELLSTLR